MIATDSGAWHTWRRLQPCARVCLHAHVHVHAHVHAHVHVHAHLLALPYGGRLRQ